MEVEFDEDLYVFDQFTCPCYNSSECTAETTTFDVDETGINSTVLIEEQWIYVYNVTQPQYYKFDVIEQPGKPCPNLIVEYDSQIGTATYNIGVGQIPSPGNVTWKNDSGNKGSLWICGPKFKFGRYFIQVQPTTYNPTSSYRVRYLLQTPLDCIPTVPPPFQSDGTYRWLQDSSPLFGTVDTTGADYYKFWVQSQCANLTVTVMKQTPVGDIDVYVDLVNPYPHIGTSEFSSTTDNDDSVAISICSTDGSDNFVVNIGVTTFVGLSGYMVVATTRNSEYTMMNDTLYSQFTFSYGFDLAHLQCPTCLLRCGWPQYDDCQFDHGNAYNCCHTFYPIAPTRSPNPIFPWGNVLGLPWMLQIPWLEPLPILPRKLAWALYIGNETYVKYNPYLNLSQCEIHFRNKLVYPNGTAFLDPVPLSPKPLTCDTDDFNTIADEMTSLITEMNQISDFTQLSLLHVKLVILNFEDAISGCKALAINYTHRALVSKYYLNFTGCLSNFEGTAANSHDRCCDQGDLLLNCCVPRNINSTYRLSSSVNNKATLNSPSSSTVCLQKKLLDFVDLQQYADETCGSMFRKTGGLDTLNALQNFISECRNNIVGEIDQGVPCQQDSDCLTTCNQITKLCNHNDSLVLKCFADSIDPTVMRLLQIIWQIPPSNNRTEFLGYLQEKIITTDCSGPHSINFRKHYTYYPEAAICPDDCINPVCFDTDCTIPDNCVYPDATSCYRIWDLFQGNPSACVSTRDCNWLDCWSLRLSDLDCMTQCEDPNLSNYTCVNCAGGTCVEVPGFTEEMCLQGLCNIDSTLNVSQCLQSSSCTANCPNCTQQQCQSSGYCSDTSEILSLMEMWNSSGICITNLESYFQDVFCEANVTFLYGCPDQQYLDPISCALGGGVWRTPAMTENECNQLIIRNSTLGPFDDNLGCFIEIPLSQGELCNLDITPYVTWNLGTWVPGQVQQLLWVKRAYLQTRVLAPKIDYMMFSSYMSEAIGDFLSYSFVTEALCRYDGSNRVIGEISCDLQGGKNCYIDTLTKTQSGAGIACSGIATTIETTEATVNFFENSLISMGCFSVQLFVLSHQQFELLNPTQISSAIFVGKNTNPYAVVVNSFNAVIGQIISDGVEIALDAVLMEAQICISVVSDIDISSDFPEYHFATATDTVITITPTTNLSISSTWICGIVTTPGVYFAALTVEGWEDVPIVDTATAAMTIVGVVVYIIVAVLYLASLVLYSINPWKFSGGIHNFRLFACLVGFIFCLARGAFLACPTGTFDHSPIGYYFIFELPTFFFFSLYTAILYLWGRVSLKAIFLSGNRFRKEERKLKLGLGAFNLALYILFLAFLIVLVVDNFQVQAQTCVVGQLNEAVSDQVINVAYQIIMATLCCIMSVGYVVSAGILFHMFQSASKSAKKTKRRKQVMHKITIFAFIFTTFFLIRSAIFLYTATSNNTIPVLLWTIIEIVPILGLLYLEAPLEWQLPDKGVTQSQTAQSQTQSRVANSIAVK